MQLNGFDLTRVSPGWWAVTLVRLGAVCAVTVAFAALGYLIRGVSRSGAVTGAAICFALFAAAGPGAFAALFSLFVVTWLATRMGHARKLRLGTAEAGAGRTATQVFANLGMASACALLYASLGLRAWLLAMTAALAEAAADTVSSEFGQAFSESARLITTFESVPAGTDGGITLAGTAAGMGAAAVVTLVCRLTNLVPTRWLWVAVACGVVGMLLDSYLGARFERRGRLNNDAVNFIGTAAAALAGIFLSLIV
ncbi:MAG TPA: DUF92 domain-containing protein [Terriglobales bacterium]|nr:DUF92 domain-containing protein [Terriglobales bacterium]HWY85302.1 DUF92 domain-containing protein [Gemmataceae bacterium]